MKTFQITYVNQNINQTKNLVSLDTYIHYIKPIEQLIYELTCELYNCGKKNKIKKGELEIKIKEQKKKLKPYGDYFVINSPLYKAITTGVLILPKIQGSQHLIIFKNL